MIYFSENVLDCQHPININSINRKFAIVNCSIEKDSDYYNDIFHQAKDLASKVNPSAANDSFSSRDGKRLIHDAFGGLLAEIGWRNYLESKFGKITRSVPFSNAAHQFDIVFTNGEIAEVRSSFVRNGVKFALCHKDANFKNIGPYSNSVKPNEIQKNLYLGVLFETDKKLILEVEKIFFSLVGGSTWEMMVNIGEDELLKPEGGIVQNKSNYRVIKFMNALDIKGILKEFEKIGYTRIQKKS